MGVRPFRLNCINHLYLPHSVNALTHRVILIPSACREYDVSHFSSDMFGNLFPGLSERLPCLLTMAR